MFAHFLFLSKFPGNHCPARLSRVMLNLKHAANSIAPLVKLRLTKGRTWSLFQSTHPRGVRRVSNAPSDAVLRVSIHAPAWGATWSRAGRCPARTFQSTHPRGVRRMIAKRHREKKLFQSTHPRGVRHGFDMDAPVIGQVSIHAPAWGATSSVKPLPCSVSRFQSTHPRGVRRRKVVARPVTPLFQSTHPRGVRQFPCFIQ